MTTQNTGLTPKEWEKEYSKEIPHWAEDKNPSKFAQEFVEEVKRRKLQNVLEIGCGNGRDSIFFAHSGLEPTAIDVAPSAVELAEGNIKDAEVEVRIQVANAEDLPFADNEFDCIFSLSVLHATNLVKSLSEVYRVLKSEGYAFIYIYGDTQYSNGKIEKTIDLDKYLQLLKFVGFVILDFYTEQEEDFDEYGEKHKLYVAYLGKEVPYDRTISEKRLLRNRYPTMTI